MSDVRIRPYETMKLSIIICTFNRSTELEELFEDLMQQIRWLRSSESKDIELVIVDNNSIDNTNEVIYKLIENTELSVKYLTHDSFGLSHCRNLAIEKATGDLLAFIHDDITLDEDWLKEAYKIALQCQDQEIGVYGGRTVPTWQSTLPSWVNIEGRNAIRQEVFRGHSHGDEEALYPFTSDFGYAEYPTSTNFLIRREVFENCGNFRTDLGPSAAGGMTLYDDVEFFEYLSCLKIPMLYMPQLMVFHSVKESRLTLKATRRWYFKYGRAQYWTAFTDRMKRDPNPLLAIETKYRKLVPQSMINKFNGIPMYLYLKIATMSVVWFLHLLTFNSKRRNYLSYRISEALGEIDAAGLVDEMRSSRKFSFRDKLVQKGLLKP
ncbi:MAG: glycosyltransferase family 2 protein [Candidatus Melainabacteria bacterium]|jgi:glucosyl-dolichyl phosphate glucuronosyltransferase|nr:glycosyltransferase family 2 protein [Candidatus Melainabacteria bacterium]